MGKIFIDKRYKSIPNNICFSCKECNKNDCNVPIGITKDMNIIGVKTLEGDAYSFKNTMNTLSNSDYQRIGYFFERENTIYFGERSFYREKDEYYITDQYCKVCLNLLGWKLIHPNLIKLKHSYFILRNKVI